MVNYEGAPPATTALRFAFIPAIIKSQTTYAATPTTAAVAMPVSLWLCNCLEGDGLE
jgi:hypothetical protein